MRFLLLVLFVIAVMLQYRLWVGPGSLAQVSVLEEQIGQMSVVNLRHQERNRLMSAQIKGLKTGLNTVEEKARMELGMIKQGETFYWFVDSKK
ncbi:Cell division protein FtsB [Sinobacterium norvegicum]|uniref:Cell division protein FtsB n=2 Tax=Sinobacterium norvegicum TaxID=1641715 RepID=A0ABM9ABV9_9GAMM|nr:Cell division protein FtsB [Sinobacterium norvegicum]